MNPQGETTRCVAAAWRTGGAVPPLSGGRGPARRPQWELAVAGIADRSLPERSGHPRLGRNRRHDEAMRRIMDAVKMPDRLAENLVMFILQNKGTLPKERREGEFKKLRDDEVALVEGIVREAFR